MGYHIAPRDALDIEDVTASIRDQPYGVELLVAGDLNANLVEPEITPRGEALADELAVAGLEDMILHFFPLSKPWLQDMFTWSMRRDGG